MIRRLTCLVATMILLTVALGNAADLRFSSMIWDFGHVGIDFKVFHRYYMINEGTDTVRIAEIIPKCDCTHVPRIDSVVAPGDSAVFRLEFDTKDYFGPIERAFEVHLADADSTIYEFKHRAIVGQWPDGLQPSPMSLFFLPTKKSQTVKFINHGHNRVAAVAGVPADDLLSVEIKRDEARRGQAIEAIVTPHETLAKGTYYTSFDVMLQPEGGPGPSMITIPVKIVRY